MKQFTKWKQTKNKFIYLCLVEWSGLLNEWWMARFIELKIQITR